MPKKKKSNNKNTPSKNLSPNPAGKSAQDNESSINKYDVNEISICDELVLTPAKRKNASKRKRNIREENERVLQMHEIDAKRLDVTNGEHVILFEVESNINPEGSMKIVWDDYEDLSLSNEKKCLPKFVTICKVKITTMGNSNSSNKNSNYSFPSPPNGISNNQLGVGEVKVSPPCLSDRLYNVKPVSESTLQHQQMQQQSQTPCSTTNTSKESKPKFSFETFVKSPSNKSQSSTPTSTPLRGTHLTKVLILPLKKHHELCRLLLKQSLKLHLRLVNNPDRLSSSSTHFPSKDVLEKSKKVLERMVIAACNDCHYTYNDIVNISFQGKRLQFEVVRSEDKLDEVREDSLNEELDELGQSIRNLNLHQDDSKFNKEKNPLSESVLSELIEKSEHHFIQYISYDTRVKFIFSESDTDSVNPEHDLQPSNIDESKHDKIIAGLDSILQRIHTFLTPILIHPEIFPKQGPIRAPRGILLHGSSGCGKTLLATQISNNIKNGMHNKVDVSIGKRIQVEVSSVDCASIQANSSIIGEAERKLSKIFQNADHRALHKGVSTLLILDDIHHICPRRGTAGGGRGVDRIASTLLALLDGIGISSSDKDRDLTDTGNVVILATTANPSLLDPALRRAGRLDSEIEVPNPDDNARAEIFEFILSNLSKENVHIPILKSDDFMTFAKLAKGFTGADCALCVKDAVRQALNRSSNNIEVKVTEGDIRQAIHHTKPSAIKSIMVEIPRVPWSSIGGMEKVKNLLKEAIELPLTHSHLFKTLKIPPPRGVLLYGPPGCSKTLMARALATEGRMNFLTVKGPELLSKWLGESERALASLFRRARLASPCVIFFDEIDAIAAKRGSSEGAGGERMLSQLLTELDGFNMTGGSSVLNHEGAKRQPRVVVVGATNRPDILDSALTRPGRIDRMIYVGLPDQTSREAIFKLQFKGKTCAADVNITQLAMKSDGFSGAEIVSIGREAALFAIEEIDEGGQAEEPMIKMKHIIRSIDSTTRQITPQMLEFYQTFGTST